MAKSTNGGRRRRPKRRGRHPAVRKLMDWTGWKRSARLARGALFVREVRLTLAALAVGFVAGVAVGLWLAPTDTSQQQAAREPVVEGVTRRAGEEREGVEASGGAEVPETDAPEAT